MECKVDRKWLEFFYSFICFFFNIKEINSLFCNEGNNIETIIELNKTRDGFPW